MEYTKLTKEELISRIENFELEISKQKEIPESTFERAAVGMAHVSGKGEFIKVNKKFAQLFGMEPADMLSKKVNDISHPDDPNIDNSEVRKVWTGELDELEIEKRYIKKDKSIFWANLTLSRVKSAQNEPKYFIAVIQDISEKKQTVDEFLKGKQLTDNVINSLPGIFYLYSLDNDDTRLVKWNKNHEIVTGYSPAELRNMHVLDFFLKKEHPAIVEGLNGIITTGDVSLEANLKLKDGKAIPYYFEGHMLSDSGKNYFLGVGLDISERKKTQDILRKSEEKYAAVVENSNDGIVIHKAGTIVYVNPIVEKELGYSPKEVIGKNMTDFIAPEYHKIVTQRTMDRLLGKSVPEITNVDLVRKDASYLSVELSTSLINYEEENALLVIIRDITERKIAENKLKDSESKLKVAQEIAQIGHWVLDLVENTLEWSDEIYRIFGVKPQEFEATYEAFLDNIHPDDREMTNKAYSESLITKEPYEIAHRLKLKDGIIKYVVEKCESIFDENGNAIRSIGTVQDITKHKILEEELRKSEKRFERLFEDLGDAVYVTKIGGKNKGRILEINRAAVKQTGYSKNELLNMNIIKDIYVAGSGDITTDEWEEKLNKGESVTTTEKKRRKDGSEFWTNVIVTSIEFKGERASLSINHDITDRKLVEERLKKSEEKYSGMIQNLMEGFYSTTIEGELLDYNPEFVRLIGLDPNKDHTGIKLPNFWQNPEDRNNYLDEFMKNGFIKNYRVNAKKTSGDQMVVQINSLLVNDEEGKPLRIEGTFIDITERILTDERIRKDIEKTKLLLDLHSIATKLSDKELFDFVLDKAVALTDSKVGFFHQVDKDQKTITLTTWNKQALERCDASYETHYPIDEAGNWVDCVHQKQPVIYNDFSKSPNQKGLPDGHFPLKRFMSIPVMDKDVVHYIFGVGNKEIDYEDHDMHQIQLIASELYKIIKQQQADEEIRKLNEELEEKIITRTKELSQEKNFSDVVINSLPGIFSLIAKDGSHIRWNKNHENVTGFSAKEYKEMKAVEFFQGTDRKNVVMATSKMFEKGKSHVEANLLTKSGKSIPYLFSGMSIEINNKEYVAGMGIDISDRKHSEKELQKKSEDLEAFNNVMIEREMRIIEMKEEVNKLSKQIGIEPPYPPVWEKKEIAAEKNKDES